MQRRAPLQTPLAQHRHLPLDHPTASPLAPHSNRSSDPATRLAVRPHLQVQTLLDLGLQLVAALLQLPQPSLHLGPGRPQPSLHLGDCKRGHLQHLGGSGGLLGQLRAVPAHHLACRALALMRRVLVLLRLPLAQSRIPGQRPHLKQAKYPKTRHLQSIAIERWLASLVTSSVGLHRD